MDLKNRKGFSLLDVLVASLIIGVCLVGTTRAIPIALKSYRNNEKQIYASLLYYSTAAYVKSLGWQAVGTTANGNFTTTLGLTGIPTSWTWNYSIKAISDGDTMARNADIRISDGSKFNDTFPCIIYNDKWN